MTVYNFLHLTPRYYPYIGGSENYIQEIGERWQAAGQAVTVYTTDAWDLEHFWQSGQKRITLATDSINGLPVRRFPVRRLPLLSPLYYPATRRLLNILSNTSLPDKLVQPLLNQLGRTTPFVPGLTRALHAKDTAPFDLVHVTNIPFDSLMYDAVKYAQQHRAALVITPFVHLGEPANPLVRKYYSMRHQLAYLNQADIVLTMTALEQDFLITKGIAPHKIRVVGVGVEPNEITGGDGARFRHEHNISGPLVLFQGAIAFDKGANHLVQAMQKLWHDYHSEATLVLAGPPLSRFERFYQMLPASDRARIRYLGFVSPETKRALFAAADLLVMPSRTDSFGIVYLEAWLNRMPVIGARAGGVPAVIEENQDGLLVNFGDVDELAAKIHLLLQDKVLSQKFGEAGYQKVWQNYTWEIVFAKIQAAYIEALEKKQ